MQGERGPSKMFINLHTLSFSRRIASSWIYAVSVTGVTGARSDLAADLPEFLKRIREHSNVRT
jgi:tryptophan synthase alpha subunit